MTTNQIAAAQNRYLNDLAAAREKRRAAFARAARNKSVRAIADATATADQPISKTRVAQILAGK